MGMIRYADQGLRSYGRRPYVPHTRHSWEFQAVVEGSCILWLKDRQERRSRTLWLFPPGCSHGWTAEPGTTCRICVVHAADVPDLLRLIAEDQGFLAVDLDADAADRMADLTAAAAAIATGDPLAGLRADAILAGLALLVAERLPRGVVQRFAPPSTPARLVEDAESWLAANLHCGPTAAEAARAVGCSASHLRRLFTRIRGHGPQDALTLLRLRRADELMRDRELTLDRIAALVGLADGSALSRAYRMARGQAPAKASGRRG